MVLPSQRHSEMGWAGEVLLLSRCWEHQHGLCWSTWAFWRAAAYTGLADAEKAWIFSWCKTQLCTSCVHLLRSSCYPWKYKKHGTKIGPQLFRWLFRQEPFELSAAASLLNVPICGTWSHPTLNELQGECQMHLFGLGWIFFCISDKWKEGCVSDTWRNVNTVMLPVVGGILLLWWSVFLNHYFNKMPFLCRQ